MCRGRGIRRRPGGSRLWSFRAREGASATTGDSAAIKTAGSPPGDERAVTVAATAGSRYKSARTLRARWTEAERWGLPASLTVAASEPGHWWWRVSDNALVGVSARAHQGPTTEVVAAAAPTARAAVRVTRWVFHDSLIACPSRRMGVNIEDTPARASPQRDIRTCRARGCMGVGSPPVGTQAFDGSVPGGQRSCAAPVGLCYS